MVPRKDPGAGGSSQCREVNNSRTQLCFLRKGRTRLFSGRWVESPRLLLTVLHPDASQFWSAGVPSRGERRTRALWWVLGDITEHPLAFQAPQCPLATDHTTPGGPNGDAMPIPAGQGPGVSTHGLFREDRPSSFTRMTFTRRKPEHSLKVKV